jgi:hypothetical protein
MSLRIPGPAIGLVLALGAAGCGSEEMFLPELGTNERLIETSAVARLADPDQQLEQPDVVGDLDGDGIDDAIVRTRFVHTASDGASVFGGAVYVLYGGTGVTRSIDLASLPALTHIGWPGSVGSGVAAVGDVDGDGLADFLVSINSTPGCGVPDPSPPLTADSPRVGGAYLVYGSTTRLTGSRSIGDVAVLLNDPAPCQHFNHASALGDVDGDGNADFSISTSSNVFGEPSKVFVFYGRDQRLSGTVDLAATADAVIGEPGAATSVTGGPSASRIGDVDGDGFDDFVVELPVTRSTLDARLVRGSATRLAGAVALSDIGHTQLPGDSAEFCFFSDLAFALGDLDGDGVDDFSLTSCHMLSNRVYETTVFQVFYGHKGELPAQIDATSAAATLTAAAGQLPNRLLAGDADGDGIRDLIVSDSYLHDGNGGVHLIKGRRERLSGAIDLAGPRVITYVGQPQRVPQCPADPCVLPEHAGVGIGLGDLTGDHRPDLLIGAAADYEGVPGPGREVGRTYVVSAPVIPEP